MKLTFELLGFIVFTFMVAFGACTALYYFGILLKEVCK